MFSRAALLVAGGVPGDVDGGIVGGLRPQLAGHLVKHHDERPIGGAE